MATLRNLLTLDNAVVMIRVIIVSIRFVDH